MTIWFIAAAAAAVANPADDARLGRMVALYDELCLRTFPDDAAVDAMMAAKGATVLTPEEVRTTLNADPGRGWLLDDGDAKIQIMIEMPPYHACSVRWWTDDGFGDLSGYKVIVDTYKASGPAFERPQKQEMDVGEFHVSGALEARGLPSGQTEALLLIEQRAAGDTRVNVRFVHQIVEPGAH